MRGVGGFVTVLATVVALTSCGSDGDQGAGGPGGGGCARRTTGLSGEGPTCSNTLECGGNEWSLDCDADGMCVCSKNGAAEMTLPYDDGFCPDDFGSANFDAHEAAARRACGWP